jgi:hypothetical protein
MPNQLERLRRILKWPLSAHKRGSSSARRAARDTDNAGPGTPLSDLWQPSKDVAAFARPIEPGKIDAVVATLPGPLPPSKEEATKPTEPDKSSIAIAAHSDLMELSNEVGALPESKKPSKIDSVASMGEAEIGQPMPYCIDPGSRLTCSQQRLNPSRVRSRTLCR